jgi:hypothetical protein
VLHITTYNSLDRGGGITCSAGGSAAATCRGVTQGERAWAHMRPSSDQLQGVCECASSANSYARTFCRMDCPAHAQA